MHLASQIITMEIDSGITLLTDICKYQVLLNFARYGGIGKVISGNLARFSSLDLSESRVSLEHLYKIVATKNTKVNCVIFEHMKSLLQSGRTVEDVCQITDTILEETCGSQLCKGRICNGGGPFHIIGRHVGSGRFRVDCFQSPDFWLEFQVTEAFTEVFNINGRWGTWHTGGRWKYSSLSHPKYPMFCCGQLSEVYRGSVVRVRIDDAANLEMWVEYDILLETVEF